LMLPAAPVPYPNSGDTWGRDPWRGNDWAANTSAANYWAAPNAAAGPWSGSYLAPVPAAPDWGQVPTTPTANQAAIFAALPPLAWNDAAQNSPGDYWRDLSSDPLFLRSGLIPTPPTGRTGPDFNTMTPAEIAAYRTQQAQRPTFGRGEGPMLAAVTSAADPFGIPSWLVGLVSPETRDKIRGQYENNPTAALVGSLATPTPRSVVTAITAAPKTVATLLGLGAVMAPDEAEAAGRLPLGLRARLDRALEMGFNIRERWYHGTDRAFDAFDLSRGGSTTGASPARQGIWLARDPEIAAEFANLAQSKTGGQPQIYEVLHRSKKIGSIDMAGQELKNHEMAATLAQAWDEGFDAVKLKNYPAMSGKLGEIMVVKSPAQLRSPHAVFDLKKRDSANLLAGFAGTGIMAPYFMAPYLADEPPALPYQSLPVRP
jgi:ADP-ribosyltransferase-like protein